ncbi:MAG TPA: TetR/AcrR family transcriptional regulator, partial [Acidobacteriota bacterium]|nr:TetR/AcrR family transcriptional regulator [Acidobacteriota bacterium]
YERQERMIISLRDAKRLRPDLTYTTAREVFWMLTGRDVYRMLVRERRWSSQKYQDWLADTLVRCLLSSGRPST